MNKGTIEQVGTPEDVYLHPASTYVAGFIGSPAMNFLSGRIAEAQRAVLIDGGAQLAVTSEAARGHDGLQVQVGLRPEQIGLALPGQPGMTAAFDFAEELGSGRLYHFLYDGQPITVHSDQKVSFQNGQDVTLTIPETSVHLFDAQTTRSLTAETALQARAAARLVQVA
jgi:sn-glycerol 3-phosphate transport system ATP-binding protein